MAQTVQIEEAKEAGDENVDDVEKQYIKQMYRVEKRIAREKVLEFLEVNELK